MRFSPVQECMQHVRLLGGFDNAQYIGEAIENQEYNELPTLTQGLPRIAQNTVQAIVRRHAGK
jgi:hypothetical protein